MAIVVDEVSEEGFLRAEFSVDYGFYRRPILREEIVGSRFVDFDPVAGA